MKKKKMLLLIIGFLAVSVVLIVILNKPSSSSNQYRIDVQPVMDRFPLLEKVEKVYWNAKIIGDNNFGPSSYWMKGYVLLDISVMKRFRETYNWKDAPDFISTMRLDFQYEQEHHWTFSEEFNNYIKPSDFIGNFYFDINNSLLYFEVEK